MKSNFYFEIFKCENTSKKFNKWYPVKFKVGRIYGQFNVTNKIILILPNNSFWKKNNPKQIEQKKNTHTKLILIINMLINDKRRLLKFLFQS